MSMLTTPCPVCRAEPFMQLSFPTIPRVKRKLLLQEWNNFGLMQPTQIFTRIGLEESLVAFSSKAASITALQWKTSLKKSSVISSHREILIWESLILSLANTKNLLHKTLLKVRTCMMRYMHHFLLLVSSHQLTFLVHTISMALPFGISTAFQL